MIPDYQSLMLPLLKYVSDEQIHNIQDAITILANQLNLTEEDLDEFEMSKIVLSLL